MLADETDAEMRAYAEEELAKLEARVATVEEELKVLLLPKDPNDEKNVILEIRAGTGGDEATLFVAEVFRMYNRYAETQKWKVEVLSTSESGVGGLKEVIALIEGDRVYLAPEIRERRASRAARAGNRTAGTRAHFGDHGGSAAGSRRSGRQDRSQGPAHRYVLLLGPGRTVGEHDVFGGAHHAHSRPNTVVSCQDEKSQIKNREKGMRVLRSRLYEVEMQKQADALAKERKQMVGSGDRSEKIRTYNFPQNRLTDHRIGFTIHQLEQVMDGKLQPIIDALITHYQAEKMKQETAGVV